MVIKMIIENIENISKSTKKSYSNALLKIEKHFKETITVNSPYDWVKRRVDVYMFIETQTESSKALFYSAVIKLCRQLGLNEENKFYESQWKKYTKISREIEKTTLTERKKKHWKDYEELKKWWDELYLNIHKKYKEMNWIDDLSFSNMTKKTKLELETCLLFGFWLSDPEINAPRRIGDFSNMLVMGCRAIRYRESHKDDEHLLNNTKRKEWNWLVYEYANPLKKILELEFNVYKTSKKYGQIKSKVNPKLEFVINVWVQASLNTYFKETKPDIIPLFCQVSNPLKCWTPAYLSKRLIQLAKTFHKKNIGASMLRNIVLSHIYKHIDLEKMKSYALASGHDYKTMLENYKH